MQVWSTHTDAKESISWTTHLGQIVGSTSRSYCRLQICRVDVDITRAHRTIIAHYQTLNRPSRLGFYHVHAFNLEGLLICGGDGR